MIGCQDIKTNSLLIRLYKIQYELDLETSLKYNLSIATPALVFFAMLEGIILLILNSATSSKILQYFKHV